MGVHIIDLNSINLFNFDDDDSETNIHVRLIAWCNRYKKRKSYKNL